MQPWWEDWLTFAVVALGVISLIGLVGAAALTIFR